ncbi:UDP-glycosyltransferase UGT5-like isoform X2 [Zerene cesonia]|nr:UDP-glycosyltransferase UGT5-like isoform X2 [Zerene cesonia]XP_038207319.1 UDP-glycosyltransferase UGT5-like isoform X2 [Zerene cesonia]XP_038207320.1 UDP-glycosyltransferase UGT5-like isoform X2 [Zerene cesonia]
MYRQLLLLTTLVVVGEAYKVLVVFPFPSRSHSILGDGVVNALAKAGHQVTYITPFPKAKTASNIRELDVSTNKAFIPDDTRDHLESHLNNTRLDLKLATFVTTLSKMFANTIETKAVQKLINDPNEKFDVIIIEWLFFELYAGLSAVFNCPFIWVSPVDPHWKMLALVDDVANPAYTPDILSDILPPFSFVQRVKELGLQIFGLGLQYFVIYPILLEDYNRILVPVIQKRGLPVPPLQDLIYNASLVLSNSHPSVGKTTSLPQNYIPVGGYHIGREVKPLPENLKKLLDNSKDGLIFFSLGSNIKSKYLPDQLKQSLLKMFGGLKQTVLWKFEEDLPGTPPNVHIVQWAPQHSILAHPNCIIFLTHGGLLSTTEAIHFGKPIIAIPVFADQFTNAKRAVQKGFGIYLKLTYNLADDIKAAVQEMLSNPRYSLKAKELSVIYHHRPLTPDKELVHWVEHVVKTGGAPHLRSLALMVPWYQKLYLDLLAVIVILIYAIVFAIKKVISYFRKNKTKSKRKTK